ncbi:MAG: hypothetical protein AAGA99_04960 [Actinomycetota bacterium]
MAQSGQNGAASRWWWRRAKLSDLVVPADQEWQEPERPRFDEVEIDPGLAGRATSSGIDSGQLDDLAAELETLKARLDTPVEVQEAAAPDDVVAVPWDGAAAPEAISPLDDGPELATVAFGTVDDEDDEDDDAADEVVLADVEVEDDDAADEVVLAGVEVEDDDAADEVVLAGVEVEDVDADEVVLAGVEVEDVAADEVDAVDGADEAPAPAARLQRLADLAEHHRTGAGHGELDDEAAAFVARLGRREVDTSAQRLSLPSRRRNEGPSVDWDSVIGPDDPTAAELLPATPVAPVDEIAAPAVDEIEEPASDEGAVEEIAASVADETDEDASLAAQAEAEADADDAAEVIDLRGARPPAVAEQPSHPPRLQAPEPTTTVPARPIDGIASSVAPTDRSAAARTTIVTSLVAGGLRSEDLLVVDRTTAASVDTISPRLDPVVADELASRIVTTTVAGEPIPLALGLGWLPSARRAARRIVSVVHHSELLTGTTWAALDAVGYAPDAPITVVVTVDPHELPRSERPDRLIQRWARRFLDLGWRAVDLRYGRPQRVAEDEGSALDTSGLDAGALDQAIAEGEVSVGGNDLSDLEWVWDAVHQSSRPTVVFTYVRPPQAGQPVLPETIAALGTQLVGGRGIDPPATFGLVRFDATLTSPESTELAAVQAVEALLRESDELAGRVALISLGRRPVIAPNGVSTIEVGDATSAAILARATHTLGHVPILFGREADLAPAVLSLSAAGELGARVVIVAMAGDEAGRRPLVVPSIVEVVDDIELVEPFAPAWVEAELRDALHRAETGSGSTYLRVSDRSVEPVEVDDAQLAPGLRRGGLLLHRSLSEPEVLVVAAGHLVRAALDAAHDIEGQGIGCDVAAITAPQRLRPDMASLDARPGAGGLDRIAVPGREHRLVVVLHDGVGLEWIGSAVGLRTIRVDAAGGVVDVDRVVASTLAQLGDRV